LILTRAKLNGVPIRTELFARLATQGGLISSIHGLETVPKRQRRV
jgi:hypothetical protein